MATQTCYDQRSFNSLSYAHMAFFDGNKEEGFKQFQSAVIPDQHKVYKQLWLNRNQPRGNLCYGEQAFNDTHGLSTTLAEKVAAIEPVIKMDKELSQQEISAYQKKANPNSGWAYRTVYDIPSGTFKQKYTWENPDPSFHGFRKNIDDIMPAHVDPKVGATIIGVAGLASMIVIVCEAISKAYR